MNTELMYRTILLRQEELMAEAAQERLASLVPGEISRQKTGWLAAARRRVAGWGNPSRRWSTGRRPVRGTSA